MKASSEPRVHSFAARIFQILVGFIGCFVANALVYLALLQLDLFQDCASEVICIAGQIAILIGSMALINLLIIFILLILWVWKPDHFGWSILGYLGAILAGFILYFSIFN